MDTTQIQTQITNLLTIVIGGLISILGIYTTIYINKLKQIAIAKSETIKDENAKKIVNDTIDKTTSLITTSITALENTTKVELVQAIQDGKIDKSELKTLGVKVQTDVLAQLGDKSVAILNDELGDVKGYISNKTEEILANLKADVTSSVSNTIIVPTIITKEVATENTSGASEVVVDDTSASSKIVVDNPDNIIEDEQNVVVTEATIPTI